MSHTCPDLSTWTSRRFHKGCFSATTNHSRAPRAASCPFTCKPTPVPRSAAMRSSPFLRRRRPSGHWRARRSPPSRRWRRRRVRPRRPPRASASWSASGSLARSAGNSRARLPQLHRISFRIMQTGEAPVGVVLRINLDGNARGAQLRHHGLEAAHPEIDHPLLLAGAKVAGRLLERCERGGAGLLLPDRIVVVRGNHRDPEVLAVPRGEALRVTRAEEQTANP